MERMFSLATNRVWQISLYKVLLFVFQLQVGKAWQLVWHMDKRITKKSNGGNFRGKECVVSSLSVYRGSSNSTNLGSGPATAASG